MGSNGHVSSIRITTLLAWSFVGIYFFFESVGLMLQVFVDSYFAGVELSGHILESVALTVWVFVGVLLVSRKPKHPIGWILCIIPVVVALDHFAYGYAYYGFIANFGTLPGVEAMIVWQYLQGRALGILGITLLFLLFPTGRPLSQRWRILAWIAVGAMAIYIPVTILAPNPVGHFPFPTDVLSVSASAQTFLAPLRWVMIIVTILCALAATYSLILRLYYARGIERQQLKWFVFAAAIFIPGTILIVVGGSQQSTGFDWIFLLGIMLTLAAITGMAVASAVAILRYRLWDIDIIIRKTLLYTAVTVSLGLVYFASVVLLQQAFRALTGQESPVAIVLSTLVIAALFNPMRNRIQETIDRRFYRRKYNAQQALKTFAATARDEVEMEKLTAELLKVVEDSLQPEIALLWLIYRSKEQGTLKAK